MAAEGADPHGDAPEFSTALARADQARGAGMGELQVGVLGPIRILRNGDETTLGGERTAALLALLALQPGRPVPVTRCIDELWPEEPPSKATNALQARVSQLRRITGRDAVRSSPEGYLLDVGADAVDACRFDRLARSGLVASDPAQALAPLEAALTLWHPEPLLGGGSGPAVSAERVRLQALHLDVLEAHVEARLEAGAHRELVGDLPEVTAQHPYREGLWAALALALYRCGRQADALARLDELRRILRDDLGLDPSPRVRELEQRLLAQDPTLAGTVPASPAPIAVDGEPRRPRTPAGALIGRESELDLLERLVATERLVTLTGPGGAGKTRLAVELARRAGDRFAGGAVFVELATVADDDGVLDAAVEAAGLRADQASAPPLERLVARWCDQPGLVVLDNCEHLVGAAAVLAEAVVERCPDVMVVATSREPLGVPGEQQVPIRTLALPEGDDVAAVAASPAAQLFLDRARRVRPDLDLDPGTAPHVAEICRRLDGIPLALELAAARTKALAVADIAGRLDDRFALLTSGSRTALPRQQTLSALIAWSHDLLFEDERRCFEELSVFVGPFDLAQAEAHCTAAGVPADQVFDLVARLVEKSLVVAEPTVVGTRYRLLESLRAFGIERLAARGDLEAARDRHARLLAELAHRADQAMRGPDMAHWLGVLDRVHDDLRAAIEHADCTDRDLAVRLAADLGLYWTVRAHRRDSRRVLPSVLASGAGDPASRARALAYGSLIAEADVDFQRSLVWSTEAVEVAETSDDAATFGIAAALAAVAGLRHGDGAAVAEMLDRADPALRSVGDDWGLAIVELLRAVLALNGGAIDEAERRLRACLEGFGRVGEPWGALRARMVVADIASITGDHGAAADHLEQAIELAEQLDWGRHQLLAELANVRMLQGDLDTAEAHHRVAIELARAQGREDTVAFAHNGLGLIARRRRDLDRARELHTEALAFWERPGYLGGLAFTRSCLGFVAEEAGDVDTARDHHLAALDAALAQADPRAVALGFEGLAGVAAARGHADHAARLLGAAHARRAATGVPLPEVERHDVDRIHATATDILGADLVAAAHAAGAALDGDAAVELARATPT
jgi:predicted ATPase/DNA-binding SARP family transcriptional activator